MEAGNKRKRDLASPRITYHAPGRTFDRLLREDSLAQLQDLVRKKLELDPSAVVKLSQVRGAVDIDLEDEDDFDAFYNTAHSASTASIRVIIQEGSVVSDNKKDELGPQPGKKKRKLDDALQLSSAQPPNKSTRAPSTSESVTSRKRAVSPTQLDATKPSDGAQTDEPPPKRPKTTSTEQPTQSLKVPVTQTESRRKSGSSAKGIIAPKKSTNLPATLKPLPPPDSSTQTGKVGVDGRKSTKTKSRKSADPPDTARTQLILKRREEILEEQAEAKKKAKKKDKAKETPVPSEGTVVPRVWLDTKSRSKKAKSSSTPKDTPQADTLASGKVAKSKSKVRETITGSVDSETNDTLVSDIQSNGPLAAITQLIFEKYLTPASSAAEVDTTTDTVIARSVSVAEDAPTKPTCPYCGRDLTHDRSRCPLIRTKFLHMIEKRVDDLRQDESEDPEGVRLNAIQALEAALRRKRGTDLKEKNINVSCSAIPPPKPTHKTDPSNVSTTEPALPARPSPSPTSSEASDESGPTLKSISTNMKFAPPLPRDDSDTESPSGDEALPCRTDVALKAISLLSQDDGNESDSPSENGSATPSQDQHLIQPESRSTLPSLIDASGYSDKDLEALIHGPGVPLTPADLPSSDSSEDEKSGDVQLDNESEQDEPSSRSRKARPPFAMNSDSSDEDVDANDENEDESFHTPPPRASVPPPITLSRRMENGMESHPIPEPSENRSFQQMGGRPGSVEMDQAGNEAFEEVLVQENAVLDLARSSTPTPPKQAIPDPATASPHHPPSPPDQFTNGEKEQDSMEEKSQTLGIQKGTVPEHVEEDTEPVHSLVPDPIEAAEAFDVLDTSPKSPIEGTEDDEPPSTPPPPPSLPRQTREEPARASTPKPDMVQRMRSRIGLASPVKKQPSASSSKSTPAAKPSTRAFRSQIKPRTDQEDGNDADAEVVIPTAGNPKSALKKGTALTNKSTSTREKSAAEKNVERVEEDKEEPDPPPRRSARMSSKSVPATSATSDGPPASSQPRPKRTRQSKTSSAPEEVVEPPQRAARKVANVTKKSKKDEANVAVKSPTPPTDEDTDLPGSQATKQEVVPLLSPPVSLDTWATTQTETPLGATQSYPMIDELQSDVDPIPFPLKPQHRRKTPSFGRKESISRLEQMVQDTRDKEKKDGKSPLFIPSESQTAFPHSQFQTDAPENADAESSNSEEEVRMAVVKKVTRNESQPSRYRRLTDIASQATRLFIPRALRQSTSTGSLQGAQGTPRAPSTRKDRLDQLYGRMGRKSGGDDDSEEDSGQGSDSEAGEASHIPKSRKAGVGPKRKKTLA